MYFFTSKGKRERKTKKMKESNIKKLLVGVVVVCFIILLIILVPFRRNVEDGKVKRNISLDIFGNVLLVNNKEPIGRTVAWNSELPYFVERDLEYALENNYEIEYCIFKSYSSIKATINIVRKDNEWTLTIKSPYSNLYNDYNELTNFSIYNDSNNNIIVYGYGHRFNEFIKYSVGQTELDYVTLTYDCNLPLDMEYESIRSYNMGEYSLVQKDNEFLFYKNGEFISSTVFPYQEISHSNIYDSFIINSEQKLYMIYAKLENKKPKLDFIYVGNADEQIETGWEKLYTNYSEDLPSMPIFKKNNEYYVPVPDNWNIYKDLFATKEILEILRKYVI